MPTETEQIDVNKELKRLESMLDVLQTMGALLIALRNMQLSALDLLEERVRTLLKTWHSADLSELTDLEESITESKKSQARSL